MRGIEGGRGGMSFGSRGIGRGISSGVSRRSVGVMERREAPMRLTIPRFETSRIASFAGDSSAVRMKSGREIRSMPAFIPPAMPRTESPVRMSGKEFFAKTVPYEPVPLVTPPKSPKEFLAMPAFVPPAMPIAETSVRMTSEELFGKTTPFKTPEIAAQPKRNAREFLSMTSFIPPQITEQGETPVKMKRKELFARTIPYTTLTRSLANEPKKVPQTIRDDVKEDTAGVCSPWKIEKSMPLTQTEKKVIMPTRPQEWEETKIQAARSALKQEISGITKKMNDTLSMPQIKKEPITVAKQHPIPERVQGSHAIAILQKKELDKKTLQKKILQSRAQPDASFTEKKTFFVRDQKAEKAFRWGVIGAAYRLMGFDGVLGVDGKKVTGKEIMDAFEPNQSMQSELAIQANVVDGSLAPRVQIMKSETAYRHIGDILTTVEKAVNQLPPVRIGISEKRVTKKDVHLVLHGFKKDYLSLGRELGDLHE